MKIAAAALLILSTTAFAGEHGREGGVNINLRNDPRAKAEATSMSVSEGGSAIAYGGSGGAGGNGGAGGVGVGGAGGNGGLGMGGAGGNSNSGGNSLSVSEFHPDKITIRQVPSFGVANIAPTAHCMGSASATLATGFFGIGGGKSYLNEHCVRQELARFYAENGRLDIGTEILCKSEYMRGISICGVK